jgi:hypothetical protein
MKIAETMEADGEPQVTWADATHPDDPVVGTSVAVWHRGRVLRVAGARLLDDRDRAGVRALLESDP